MDALGEMSLKTGPGLEELETELADVNTVSTSELLGIGREVPWLDPVSAKLYHLNILHSGDCIIMRSRGCQ